jgi:protein ImuB
MRRVVSVWLPDWPVTVWSRTAGRSPPPDGQPFALVERGVHGLTLSALNPAARALGLTMGQGQADACAAAPHLATAPAEPHKDSAALKRLALWAERFSPLVAIDAGPPGLEGLLIDMTGAAHLFGGEQALLEEMAARLARAGIPARCALADTVGAAWALARFSGYSTARAAEGEAKAALASLPMAALRLSHSAIKLLARLGLKQVGDLYALPRSGVARRFRSDDGLTVIKRLDQATGDAAEPLIPERPLPRYRAWRVFAEPMLETEGAAFWLPDLVEGLTAQLERDGVGARRIRLAAFRVDGGVTAISAVLSRPSIKPDHLIRLLRETGFEKLDLGFGADALMLSALTVEPLQARQAELETSALETAEDALAGLIDRLKARLGDEAVRRPVFLGSWLPERSEQWSPVRDLAVETGAPAGDAPRPILVFHPPEPVDAIAELPDAAPARFIWRRVAHKVVRSAGPERLSPEWWRPETALRLGAADEPPRTRDYYRVEDEDGRRFWLFREGLYGREDVSIHNQPKDRPEDADEALSRPPTWWLQGVFA